MGKRRPRVLLVTRNLPPLVGGMERLNWHMAAELSKIADVHIVGPAGSAAVAPAGIPVREASLKPLWKFLLRARSLARREARAWQPDVVLAGSGLTTPVVRSAARTCGARMAVYVHGLDVAVRHPVYRAVWLPSIRRMDRVIANSHATAKLCESIGVDATKIGIVYPGVDLPVAAGHPSPSRVAASPDDSPPSARRGSHEARGDALSAAQDFRQRRNLGDGPLLLSVGRLSTRKGLREFVANCMPRIVAACPDAMLLVVGGEPSDALHAKAQTAADIEATAAEMGIANNVHLVGKVLDDELDAIYRAVDVHVFPVRDVPGDVEGFGMVAVEAAAHGVPTVAFAVGGVMDAVAEARSGRLVMAGDYAAFAEAVLQSLKESDALRAPCVEFADGFAWPRFGHGVATQLFPQGATGASYT